MIPDSPTSPLRPPSASRWPSTRLTDPRRERASAVPSAFSRVLRQLRRGQAGQVVLAGGDGSGRRRAFVLDGEFTGDVPGEPESEETVVIGGPWFVDEDVSGGGIGDGNVHLFSGHLAEAGGQAVELAGVGAGVVGGHCQIELVIWQRQRCQALIVTGQDQFGWLHRGDEIVGSISYGHG